LNAAKHHVSQSNARSKSKSDGTIRLMKWLVLIVLLMLLLLALFLPGRGLAAPDARSLTGQNRDQLSPIRLPSASSTPSEKRIRTWSPSISKGTAIRASSW
jgi:hypothetical protein